MGEFSNLGKAASIAFGQQAQAIIVHTAIDFHKQLLGTRNQHVKTCLGCVVFLNHHERGHDLLVEVIRLIEDIVEVVCSHKHVSLLLVSDIQLVNLIDDLTDLEMSQGRDAIELFAESLVLRRIAQCGKAPNLFLASGTADLLDIVREQSRRSMVVHQLNIGDVHAHAECFG